MTASLLHQSADRPDTSFSRRRKVLLLPLTLAAIVAMWALPIVADDFELITVEGQKKILSAPASPSTGATAPEVTIVEYFDYNCPYCKRLVPVFQALMASDPTVALVYKDWPILSAASIYAAHCALAAKWQGKYIQAHDALINGPRLSSSEQVDGIFRKADIDMTRLKADLDRHAGTIEALLDRNDSEARALSLRGTPGVLVGRQLVSGMPDLPTLQKLVARARHP
jgi:protein-disulfide isomerase